MCVCVHVLRLLGPRWARTDIREEEDKGVLIVCLAAAYSLTD